VKSNQAYKVSTLCRTLDVSPSGYYAWLSRESSTRRKADILLGDRIEAIYRRSRSTYGRPRIKAELQADGISVSNDRLARLMRERKLYGASRRKGFRTTVRDRDARPAPDLVERNFCANEPTSSGLQISRTSRRGAGFSSSQSFSTNSAGESSVGRWPAVSGPRW
jgi:putative transposase